MFLSCLCCGAGDLVACLLAPVRMQPCVLLLPVRLEWTAPLFTKGIGRRVVPTLKGAMESTGFREAQQESHFADGKCPIREERLCRLFADLLAQSVKRC